MATALPRYPRFLLVYAAYVQPREWITSSELALRIYPGAHGDPELPGFAKEVSRKLSNLNRFGYLDREPDARGIFQYRWRAKAAPNLAMAVAGILEAATLVADEVADRSVTAAA